MASNYPPGVTGREYEIAGPDSEWPDDGECSNCDFEGTVLMTYFRFEAWFDCPKCGKRNDRTLDVDWGPDPDDLRDEMLDHLRD